MLGGVLEDIKSAETRQFVGIIDGRVDQMQYPIGDLIDAGRIHAGALSVDTEAVVAALLEQARTTFLASGGRTLRGDLAPGLPRVMADERRIVQVPNNLITNAAVSGNSSQSGRC